MMVFGLICFLVGNENYDNEKKRREKGANSVKA